MTIGETINGYAKTHTPYIGRLVNHLPMGQLAIFKMTEDFETVEGYTKLFLEKASINQIKDNYPTILTIEDAVGNRSLYESCLDLVEKESQNSDMDKYVNYILNKYILGLSSGLFHTSIRMAYAIEGLRIDPLMSDEVQRALAYYITAYRESKLFTRRIQGSMIKEEMNKLVNDNQIKEILSNNDSLGKKIRALYNEDDFLNKGFIIDGDEEEKIKALLDLLVSAYYFSGNIVTLHCITGLHAVIVLKDYFDDYSNALDVLTTSILTHLLTIDYHNYNSNINDFTYISWEAILSIASEQADVHAVKLCYTCFELSKLYGIKGLKEIAIKRIRH